MAAFREIASYSECRIFSLCHFGWLLPIKDHCFPRRISYNRSTLYQIRVHLQTSILNKKATKTITTRRHKVKVCLFFHEIIKPGLPVCIKGPYSIVCISTFKYMDILRCQGHSLSL